MYLPRRRTERSQGGLICIFPRHAPYSVVKFIHEGVHMAHISYLPATEDPTAAAQPSPTDLMKERLFPLRVVLWTVTFLLFGLALGKLLLPLMSNQVTQAILSAHMPQQGISFSRVFLSLCLACFPWGLCLMASGLTGFSKTVICFVTCFRGICEGLSLCLLLSAAVPRAFLWAFCGWTIIRCLCRILLSVSARRTAVCYFHTAGQVGVSSRPAITKHLAISLVCFLSVTLATGSYSACLISLSSL